MSTKFKNVKGTFDILPYGSRGEGAASLSTGIWHETEEAVRRVLAAFDYDEIRTPILEPAELISRGIGEHSDIVTKEMFAFSRGRDNYVLRPEITAPVLRAVLQHPLQQDRDVHRLYYIGPCFRAERPQKGRHRQFHQFGCEIIGAEGPRADADVILAMLAVYRYFGLTGFRLRLNSLGSPATRKKYAELLRSYFSDHIDDLSETSQRRLRENPLRLLDTKIESERALLVNAPTIDDLLESKDAEHFDEVKTLLNNQDVVFEVDPFLVRGLDYYTRTAFELELDTLGAQNALAGGGRYDLLGVELGANVPVPAVGFAAGFERLLQALIDRELLPDSDAAPDAMFISLGPRADHLSFSMVQRTRETGLRVTFDAGTRSIKAQMRAANKRRARYVVVIGDDEITQDSARIKNMRTGDELTVPFSNIAGWLADAVTNAGDAIAN